MVICMFFLPHLPVCKHPGINQGDKGQLGVVRGYSDMISELRAEKWEWFSLSEALSQILSLSVVEQQASHRSLCNGDLFHHNINCFSKVSDETIKKGWSNNQKQFPGHLSRPEV